MGAELIAAVSGASLARGHGVVLHDVTLSVRAGERIALVGPNGAGKSSLLRLLAGLTPATSGEVTAAPKGSGYVPQAAGESLFPWFPVLKNVALPRLVAGLADALEVARGHLHRLAPTLAPDRRAVALSGGEQQLVSLARALTAPGPIVFADEPFSSLAPGTRERVRDAVGQALGGRALVLVTHDLADAEALGARVLEVVDGRLTGARR